MQDDAQEDHPQQVVELVVDALPHLGGRGLDRHHARRVADPVSLLSGPCEPPREVEEHPRPPRAEHAEPGEPQRLQEQPSRPVPCRQSLSIIESMEEDNI